MGNNGPFVRKNTAKAAMEAFEGNIFIATKYLENRLRADVKAIIAVVYIRSAR
jgi:hypothetical protein